MENITLNQLAYRVLGLYRAAHKETDSLSIRLIKDWIHSIRAMLLKQRLDKPFAYIDDQLIQTYKQVDPQDSTKLIPLITELVDSSQFELISSGRSMLRTIQTVPPTINRRGQIGTFTRIGPIDRLDKKYKVVSHETALVSGYGKFNMKDIYVFILDEKIYLIGRDLDPKEMIDVRGVFQNPEQIPGFSHDGPYPINRELVDAMEDIIVKTKFPTTLIPYSDTKSDESDNIVQTTERKQ
jgi:hypothetical protein